MSLVKVNVVVPLDTPLTPDELKALTGVNDRSAVIKIIGMNLTDDFVVCSAYVNPLHDPIRKARVKAEQHVWETIGTRRAVPMSEHYWINSPYRNALWLGADLRWRVTRGEISYNDAKDLLFEQLTSDAYNKGILLQEMEKLEKLYEE